MTVMLAIGMIAVICALVLSLIVVHTLLPSASAAAPRSEEVGEKPTPAPVVPAPSPAPASVPFKLPPPPEGSVRLTELEIGQKVILRTVTSKYILIFRSAEISAFDAVRIGPDEDGGPCVERSFTMLLEGTFVPNVGFYGRCLVPGGTLSYKSFTDSDDNGYRVSETMPLRAILVEDLRAA